MLKITHKRDLKFYYSPLRYPGGKTFLFPFIANAIKHSGMRDVTYIEPFAGGAGAALALLFLEKVDRIIINDMDTAIYSFWKSAVFNADRFIEKIKSTSITIEEWKKQQLIYTSPKSNCFDLGFASFFLNRTNISGILGGGPIGGLEQTGKWKIDARFNKEQLIKKIQQISLYKNRIAVSNEDGLNLIKNHLNEKDCFVYLDPPYYEKGATLYLNHYQKEDHEKLAAYLNDNPNAFWLLTYDYKKEIKSLYPDRQLFKFSLNYNAREAYKGKELMILSDAFAF